MALARAAVAVLLLAVIVAAGALGWSRAQTQRLELAWAKKLKCGSAAQSMKLQQKLVALGAKLERKGPMTEISYSGSAQNWCAIVNELTVAPQPWELWQSRVLSPTMVKGSVAVAL